MVVFLAVLSLIAAQGVIAGPVLVGPAPTLPEANGFELDLALKAQNLVYQIKQTGPWEKIPARGIPVAGTDLFFVGGRLSASAGLSAPDSLDILFFKGPGRCDALSYRVRSNGAPAELCVYQGLKTACVEYTRERTTLNGAPCRTTETGALLCGLGGERDARVETDFDPNTMLLSYFLYMPGRPASVIFPEPISCRGLRFERRNRPTSAGSQFNDAINYEKL